MKKSFYLLLGLLLVCGIYQACAPEELPGSIYGTVVDKATGEPIKSAGVELSPSGLKTVTGSEGQFEFTELDPGKYTLIITKTGYMDGVSHTIEVKPGQQAKGDVQIEKLPPALKVVNDNREEISTLDFGSAEDDVARSFSLFNDGTESLEWQITTTAEWIKSVSKIEGVLSAGATQSLIITIDRTKLSSGENKTTVHITSNNGSKQLVVIARNDYQLTMLNILPVTDITTTSAVLNGEIINEGYPQYSEHGFVYAETHQPTVSNTIQKLAAPISNNQTFSVPISNIAQGKTYYVRAYAIQMGKEVYSMNEVFFKLADGVIPSITTSAATQITNNSAVVGGNVTNDGGIGVTERGVVYSTNPLPTIADTKVVSGSGLGAFTCILSNLEKYTTYYIRAYAINYIGIAYGEQIEFTTLKSTIENGHEWVDLGVSVKWATCNVGANRPEEYGGYYAWGETKTKSTYTWNNYKWGNGNQNSLTKYCTDSWYGSVDNKTSLELSDDAAHANWGGSWRMPSCDELMELIDECDWKRTTRNGVNGYKITNKFNEKNSIFIPMAGYFDDYGTICVGEFFALWARNLTDYSNNNACCYVYVVTEVHTGISRSVGLPIRPVCP